MVDGKYVSTRDELRVLTILRESGDNIDSTGDRKKDGRDDRR